MRFFTPAAIGPYSQGIICNGIAFFSGQIPLSPITGEVGLALGISPEEMGMPKRHLTDTAAVTKFVG